MPPLRRHRDDQCRVTSPTYVRQLTPHAASVFSTSLIQYDVP